MTGRRRVLVAAALLAVSGLNPGLAQAGTAGSASTALIDYTVLLDDGAARDTVAHDAALAAIRTAGGTVLRENPATGVVVVAGPHADFAERVSAAPGVLGAARSHAINRLPGGQGHDEEATPSGPAVTRPRPAEVAATGRAGMDPLDARLWGLRMVRSDLARERQPGDRRVLVGVLDSGIDATHPDLAPNVDRGLSRNFVVDIPYDENGTVIDGPCEFRGCVDPPNHDDYGHGTHVAGTTAAAANGFGVSGVAPKVTLVDIRVGQDSGYVFLQPVLDAITYGADIGLNVMDLTFAIDPWIYNCVDNPADTPEQQLQQRTTIIAMNRALDYAHRKGVTLVNETGYTHDDLGRPHPDTLSPNYPPGAAYPRQIDNATCRACPLRATTSSASPVSARRG